VRLQISDLREQPEFFDTVADRIWRAWWKPHGHSFEKIAAGLNEMMKGDRIPFAIVAHDGAEYFGSSLGIASDMAERPQYSPWVAAVWVEPQFRSRRIGRVLIAHAADHALAIGAPRVYLTARPARRSLYEQLGWSVVEEGVGELAMTVFARDA